MKMRLIRAAIVLPQVVLIVLLCGCASSSPDPEGPGKEGRTIDRVRAGIAAVKDQVSVTVAAATLVVAEPVSQVSRKRETFERERLKTGSQIQSLTADARELKQRAAHYLTVWGGQVATFHSGASGLAIQANSPRQAIKSKYDEMVEALIAARDSVVPLQSGFQQLESAYRQELSASQIAAARTELQKVTVNSQVVNRHLETALSRLDELHVLLVAANAPKAQ